MMGRKMHLSADLIKCMRASFSGGGHTVTT